MLYTDNKFFYGEYASCNIKMDRKEKLDNFLFDEKI